VTVPGAVLGLGLASVTVPRMVSLLPVQQPIPLPGIRDIGVNSHTLLFTVAISLMVSGVIGLLPIVRNSLGKALAGLKEEGFTVILSRRQTRFFSLLMVSQTALAIILLSGASVTVKSLWQLFALDQGFDMTGIVTFRTPLSRVLYPTGADWSRVYTQYTAEVERLPGVVSAAVANAPPLTGGGQVTVGIESYKGPSSDAPPRASLNVIGPNYFKTLRIPILAGRDFTPSDDASSAPVVIVSKSFAMKYWPNVDPIGRRIRVRPQAPWATVIAVAGDIRAWANAESSASIIYRPYTQAPSASIGYVVRTAMEPAGAQRAIEKAIQLVNNEQPVTYMRPLVDEFIEQIYPQRITAIGLSTFGSMALLLAGAGLFGTTLLSVRQRRREIAIRLALGARARQILASIVYGTAKLVVLGCFIGFAGGLALNRAMQSILYGVGPGDASAFAAVTVLLAAVGSFACLAAALDGIRIQPAASIRAE
jgi:predicted permease